MNARVLIVDDEQSMCELLQADLRLRDYDVAWCTSAEEGLLRLAEAGFDVVLTDLKMPRVDGIQFCKQIVANRPDIPVIVMTAFGSLETAIAAIRVGAYDFVTKPVEMDLLALTLQRAVKHRQLQEQIKVLSEVVERTARFEELLGESPPMQQLYGQLAQIADSEASVLITGESGTGKELVARSLHRRSRRRGKPFVAVNCPALPETLLESELFGHSKGAFTDARSDREGLFVQAEGGTLFFDEIGELPLPMQPKLLRALEEGSIRPVGGQGEVPFDARILAATNRDLESAVEEGRFREDLFFRVNVIQVELPPLRSRGTDVLLLAQHFVELFAARSDKPVEGLSEAAAQGLLDYPWPGNVRELRNVIERAVALTRYSQITLVDLPEKIRTYQSSQVFIGGTNPGELIPMEQVERRYVRHVLEAVGGNKTLAARILGFDRKTLYRKLREDEASE